MKKKLVFGLVVVFVFAFVTSVYAQFGDVVCPRCNVGGCMWTGATMTDAWGMYNEYKCMNGHHFWVKM